MNSISVDKSGDTIATAGEDGNVNLQILSENSRIPHKYTTAIRVFFFIAYLFRRVFVLTQLLKRRCLSVVV